VGNVSLQMKHALTCVGFQITGDGDQLTAISISGVSVSGDLVMNGGDIVWTNLGSPTTTDFSASINYDTGEDYFTIPSVMTNLIASDGYLMMIPQALGSDAKIKLTFNDDTTKEISLDNFTWEAGKRITYNITVPTLEVSSVELFFPPNPSWQEITVTTNNPDGFTLDFSDSPPWLSSVNVEPNSNIIEISLSFNYTISNSTPPRSGTFRIIAGNLTKTVTVHQKGGFGGYADRITVSGTGDNAKLVITADPTDMGVYFKFGSVVGITSNGAFSIPGGSLAFNPLATPSAITNYATVPNFSIDIFPDISNISLNNYHNLANVKAGRGDPCRLIGMTAKEIRDFTSDAQLYAREAELKAEGIGGWRLPDMLNNAYFVGSMLSIPSSITWWEAITSPFSGIAGIELPERNHADGGIRKFLPAAGTLSTVGALNSRGTEGRYWLNEALSSGLARSMSFRYPESPSPNVSTGATNPNTGATVRCICENE